MRQQEIDAAAKAAATTAYDEPYGWQDDGSCDVGTFRSRHNHLQRMSTFGAVSRNSLQFRHANERVRRWIRKTRRLAASASAPRNGRLAPVLALQRAGGLALVMTAALGMLSPLADLPREQKL
jgi:hypothetical protein